MVALGGCGGGQSSQLTGIVTLDGKPLDHGTITLHPVNPGPIAVSRIDAQGRFQMTTGQATGLRPGPYIVTIAAVRPPPSTSISENELNNLFLTPRMYSIPETSGLKIHVVAGSMQQNFELRKAHE